MNQVITNVRDQVYSQLDRLVKSEIGVFFGRVIIKLQRNLPEIHPVIKVAAGALLTFSAAAAIVIKHRRKIDQLTSENKNHSKVWSSTTNLVKGASSEIIRLKTKKTSKNDTIKQLEDTNKELTAKINTANQKIEDLEANLEELTQQNTTLITAADDLTKSNTSLQLQNRIAVIALQQITIKHKQKDEEILSLKNPSEALTV